MKNRVASFVLLLGLLTLVLPGAAMAGDEEASPKEVAEWLLFGDPQDILRAVKIMQGASSSFLYDVAMAIREQRLPVLPTPPVREPTSPPPLPPLPMPVPRAPGKTLVLVETEIWAMPGEGPGGVVQGGPPGMVEHLDDFQVKRLRHALERIEGASVLTAPSIVVLDGEQGEITVGEDVTYVESVQVDRDGGHVRAIPVLETIREGHTLAVTPRVFDDRSEVNLTVSYEGQGVIRPIPTREVVVEGLDEPFEVQTPEVSVSTYSATVNVPLEGAVLLAGLDDPADAKRTLMLVISAGLIEAAPPPVPLPFEPPAGPQKVVTLQARVLEVTEDALVRAVPQGIPTPDKPARMLDAEDVVALLGPGRKGGEGVTILNAPRITTYSGQMANVSMISEVSYIQDFDIEVGMGGTVSNDPIIGTVQEGLTLDMTPTIRSGPTPIHVELNATWSDLVRPIQEHTTRLGGLEVTIQIPEVKVSGLKAAIDAAPGAYVLFGGFTPTPKGHRLILLRATIAEIGEPADPWVPGKPDGVTPR